MNRNARRQYNKHVEGFPRQLTKLARAMWPETNDGLDRVCVWVSRDFLVQQIRENDRMVLAVNRTKVMADGEWQQNISWDELQNIKNEVGFADKDCVEVYPAQMDVVNVAGMRWLWISETPLDFVWRRYAKKT